MHASGDAPPDDAGVLRPTSRAAPSESEGPRDWTQPIALPARDADAPSLLLVHGFSGSPFELHLLAQHLNAAGYQIAVPRLAGHHDTLATLAASTWGDWLASAEQALHTLWQQTCARTDKPALGIIGLSMGGLLSLDLARRYPAAQTAHAASMPAIRALCTIASPLSLRPTQERAIRRFARTPGLRRLAVPKLLGADVRDRTHPPPLKPRGMPIVALNSLLDLMVHVRGGLSDVRQPALLLHAIQDHTAPYASMAAIAAGLSTPADQLRSVALPRSYHLLPLDVEREIVFAEVAAHVARYVGSVPNGPAPANGADVQRPD